MSGSRYAAKLEVMSERELYAYMQATHEKVTRILFLIDEIADETDPEVVDVYIDMLTIAKKDADNHMGIFDPQSVRELIREGEGDFGKLTEKCIQMKLV